MSTKSDFMLFMIDFTLFVVYLTVFEIFNILFIRFFISLPEPMLHKTSSQV